MSWNYRIMRHKAETGTTYALHEAYSEEGKKPDSFTTDAISGHYETVDELVRSHEMMAQDAHKYREVIIDFPTGGQ